MAKSIMAPSELEGTLPAPNAGHDLRAAAANANGASPEVVGALHPVRGLSYALNVVIEGNEDNEDNCVGGVRIVADNLSEAWTTAIDAMMRPGVKSIEPMVVTVTGFDADSRPRETPIVVSLIDAELRAAHEAHARAKGIHQKHGPLTVASAANTIFPESLWNSRRSREDFYERYIELLPRLKRDSRNRRGIYFERLIAYGRGPDGGNQLEHMIRAFAKKVKRTSAYQATIADPKTDLMKTPLLGFPCLQQIAVHPSERTGTLAITGFYGTQYLFERGYGNYLGLCRLGRFLAHEMGLRLTRMTCVASYAPTEGIGKSKGRILVAAARRAIAEQRDDSAKTRTAGSKINASPSERHA